MNKLAVFRIAFESEPSTRTVSVIGLTVSDIPSGMNISAVTVTICPGVAKLQYGLTDKRGLK